MKEIDEINTMVSIRRSLNGQIASAKLCDLTGFEWLNFSGGIHSVMKSLPTYHLIAYVQCTKVFGEIDHSCKHGPPPHYLRVMILKIDNASIWEYFVDKYGQRPKQNRAKPYKVDSDAKAIVHCIINNLEHPALEKRNNLIILYPKRLDSLVAGCTESTAISRSTKLKACITKLMTGIPGFKETTYRNCLAFASL